ncbi:dihydrofolate reductase family protein [Saccharomonospora xinjiangensis]|uniref:dihydrofolate reductase family protein n=1 Tax=Saccharomonospora xinjiangensis TaxID=75294 RepID=UPI003510CB4B
MAAARKLKLWMQVSLDGYVAGPNGEFDWTTYERELNTFAVEQAAGMGAMLYGRKVYEGMAAYWPDPRRYPGATELDLRFSEIWKPVPKYVFSTTLREAGWNTTVVSEDVAGAVAELKEQRGGDLVLFGGSDIVSTFVRENLIDEYWLFVHPVVLGGGTPLFPSLDKRLDMELVESRVFDSAVNHLRYRIR